MLAALKESPEAGHLVQQARKDLTGVKGTLVQKKKAVQKSKEEGLGAGGLTLNQALQSAREGRNAGTEPPQVDGALVNGSSERNPPAS